MVEHDQINVRVPEPARGVLKDLAERLRRDAGFLPRLKRWMAEEADNGQATFLSDRIERLEARVADLARRLDDEPGRSARPRQVDMFAGQEKPPVSAIEEVAPEGWTAGEGRGRRLTDTGKAELRRRLEAGESDREIADVLGVKAFTVSNQRKAIQPII